MTIEDERYDFFLMEGDVTLSDIPDTLLPMVEQSIEVKTRKYEIQARFNGGWLTYNAITQTYE